MLTSKEIQDIVRSGEGYNVEFKRTVPSKVRDLSEEVCSFLNASGGYLLIGVTDECEIVGAEIDNSKRSAIHSSIGEISPMCHYDMYNVDVEGKIVWVIDVPSGKNKPYFINGNTFLREGTNSQKLTNAAEIRELFQYNERVYFDAIPIPRFNLIEQLDENTIETFKKEAHIYFDVNNNQLLDSLRVFDDDNLPKSGGILFFASHPENVFYHAVIRCVMFKGCDKVYILDDKTFGGPLVQQYTNCMQWLQSKLEVEYEIKGTGPRTERWKIPLEVFKEAVINALAHRDYEEQGASITVEIYEDRVEVSNPGVLLPAVARNFGKKSLSRNPLLFGLFTRMHLVEHIGSGIPRMKMEMKQAGLREPQFDTEGMFTVTFYRPNSKKNLELSLIQKKIVELMIKTPSITTMQIAEQLHIGRTTVNKELKTLREFGVIKHIGQRNNGEWVVDL